jgi:hypothetical protein
MKMTPPLVTAPSTSIPLTGYAGFLEGREGVVVCLRTWSWKASDESIVGDGPSMGVAEKRYPIRRQESATTRVASSSWSVSTS